MESLQQSEVFLQLGEIWLTIFAFDFVRYLAGVLVALAILFGASHLIELRKIQSKTPSPLQKRRELFHSITTVCVYATIGIMTWLGKESGDLKIYHSLESFSMGYAILSFFLLMLAHDTYFYWVHRMMHHPLLFPHMHRIHHQSRTPTPWAAYSFNLAEAVMMALFVPIYLFVFPTYEMTLFSYLAFMILRNALGHSGYELFPAGFTGSKWGWNNTHFHHDLHHQSYNYNFSLYFTWWDRWMGTEHPEYHTRFESLMQKKTPASSLSITDPIQSNK